MGLLEQVVQLLGRAHCWCYFPEPEGHDLELRGFPWLLEDFQRPIDEVL